MWEGATARGTKGVNFLVMDRLKKNGSDQQEFKHNMTFLMQSKLTGSMQVEEFWVREVGRIYGKDKINRTMYRCVVLQRRVQGEKAWNDLESFNAANMPGCKCYIVGKNKTPGTVEKNQLRDFMAQLHHAQAQVQRALAGCTGVGERQGGGIGCVRGGHG